MSQKLLLIGPRFNQKEPKKSGGAIVLFENLLSELKHLDVAYEVIDSNKKNYPSSIIAPINILIGILIKQKNANHISLHSSNDYKLFAPVLILISKFSNKQISLRKFGGEVWNVYSKAKGLKKQWLKFIFKNVDYLFLEIQFIVSHFKNINNNSFWFPNVRSLPQEIAPRRTFSKRFVFISQVFPEKGVDQILEVSNQLPDDYSIHIYGPLKSEKYTNKYFNAYKAQYCGALESHKVLDTLSTYDVLLLPSYYKGEGYPGIIIESYSIGVPIIASNLAGIQEITDVNKTGILVPPKDTFALKKAILHYNEKNYTYMSKKAKEKFKLFQSPDQTKKFLTTIQCLKEEKSCVLG